MTYFLDGGEDITAIKVRDHGHIVPTSRLGVERLCGAPGSPASSCSYACIMWCRQEGMMEELGANPVFNDPEWHDITRAQASGPSPKP
jgi:hypothetical protein